MYIAHDAPKVVVMHSVLNETVIHRWQRNDRPPPTDFAVRCVAELLLRGPRDTEVGNSPLSV